LGFDFGGKQSQTEHLVAEAEFMVVQASHSHPDPDEDELEVDAPNTGTKPADEELLAVAGTCVVNVNPG